MTTNSILLGIPFWAIAEYIVGAVIGFIIMLPFGIAIVTDSDLGDPPRKKKPKQTNVQEKEEDPDKLWSKYS